MSQKAKIRHKKREAPDPMMNGKGQKKKKLNKEVFPESETAAG